MTPRAMGAVLTKLASGQVIDRFVSHHGPDPFRILVACILSLRTKDEVTYPAAARLFARADDPRTMLGLSEHAIAKTIYPVGFYRTKAKQIHALSKVLLTRHGGRVPDSIDELLTLPGVGRKTANLTITLGFGKPGICVDTHVHRIANRLGWIATRSPDESEAALRRVLPKRWWIPINETLVRHGQQVCKPLSPVCSACAVTNRCPKIGVTRFR